MRRFRGSVPVVTGLIATVGLGLVVAVAASSLPREPDEPLFRMGRVDLDLSGLISWLLLALAVAGMALLVAGLRRGRPEGRDRRAASLLGLILALVVFAAIYRWLRPLADSATETPGTGGDATASGAEVRLLPAPSLWVLALLITAVVAAVLTRVGLSLPSSIDYPAGSAPGDWDRSPGRKGEPSFPAPLGSDPRARVVLAYERFEGCLEAAGYPRPPQMTTGRHAARAAADLGLDSGAVSRLVRLHHAARYGREEPLRSAADDAEHAASRLIGDLGS